MRISDFSRFGTILTIVAGLTFAAAGIAACGDDDSGDDGTNSQETLGFMEECTTDDDRCDKSQDPPLKCFVYMKRGTLCTHDCTADDECVEPSRGCNNKGVCQAP